MRLRQEQVVFAVALVTLGLLVARSGDGARGVRGGSRPSALEIERFGVPPVERALPADEVATARDAGAFEREVFSPPRDTRPLAPLDFVEPPRPPLPVVFPPPSPGPAPRHYARFLHTALVVRDVPDLFARDDEEDVQLPEIDGAGGGGDAPYAERQRGDDDAAPESAVSRRAREVLLALGDGQRDGAVETAAERAARIGGYKRLYDWIRLGDFEYLFGRIENEDRYGIEAPGRASEPILFRQLDPETGEERFRGQDAIAYDRSRVTSLGFADTTPNRIELRRRELGDISRGNYSSALELASWCVRVRHEAPRALEVAEELFRELASFDPDDPLPRLGLARCLEAGFDFEGAFGEYNRLLETFGHRAAVHVRLAQLEARFLLHERAEERLRRAVELESASYEPNWALGVFLTERGRPEEALPYLERADQNAPREPERKDVRMLVRLDLARAQLRVGELEAARTTCRQALRAEPENGRARAAMISVQLMDGSAQAVLEGDAAGSDEVEAGFELLLARGLLSLRLEEWAAARDQLSAAAELDPLRAHLAWRSLAYLAEVTGYPEQALAYAERAVECDPRDAYAQYMLGRLLAAIDDVENARDALGRALEADLDFEDAMIELADLAFQTGRFADCERYLERTVQLAPERADVHALRGLNFLAQDLVERARESFEAAADIDSRHPTARAGLAWAEYLGGGVEEALIQLANLDEARRARGDDDPWRLWAAQQIERITDHREKVAWEDAFERRDLRNNWFVDEGVGPRVEIVDGAVRMAGVYNASGRTRLFREYPAGIFVSMEADVRVAPGSLARVGLFASRERERRGRTEVISEASVSRHKDGDLQLFLLRSGQTDDDYVDIRAVDFPAGEWVRLRVERSGASADAAVTLSVNGIPVAENEPMVGLGRATSALRVGLFAEGETGRQVEVLVDNVEVVFRQS